MSPLFHDSRPTRRKFEARVRTAPTSSSISRSAAKPIISRSRSASALIRQARKLPTELYKSLTWGRGKELADHRRFSLATDIDVYFCDPQSPWQRGSNENTNGLLRQYFPKGTDVSVYSQAHLNKVARVHHQNKWDC